MNKNKEVLPLEDSSLKIRDSKLSLRVKKQLRIIGEHKVMKPPKFVWDKFNGKKLAAGILITAAGAALDYFVPLSHFASGYVIDTGIGMMVVGAGHKMVKHKKFIKFVVLKLLKKGR